MNIGVISSSNGSSFIKIFDILNKLGFSHNFIVVTDRECGIMKKAQERGIPVLKITKNTNYEFSCCVVEEVATKYKLDVIFLYFTRMLDAVLFEEIPIINFHSSMLPAFSGLSAISKAVDAGVRFFGSTMHVVDNSIDGGMIIAQTASPMSEQTTRETLRKYAYIQNIYLGLLFFDLVSTRKIMFNEKGVTLNLKDSPSNHSASPCLSNSDYIAEMKATELKAGTSVFLY